MAVGEYNRIGRIEPGTPTTGKTVSGIEDEDGEILEITVRKCVPGVAETQVAYTATTSSTEAKAANNDRIVLVVQNNGATNVYFSFAGAATVAAGIVLEPGAVHEEVWSCNALTVIVSSGTEELRIREVAKQSA
jgi:hypothetical protein